MCSKHQHGEGKSVVCFDVSNASIVNQATLNDIFDHPNVKNRKIVTFSVIGAFRKGKSFLLDYCLRYLYAHYISINFPENPLDNSSNWMGDENDPLQGFSWRSGVNRDTTGIIMWSDVFLHTVRSTGEKIAIVVIDTQGLFDSKTLPADNARIFSLGTLISSEQVFNLSGQIQEDNLQYLQFATELAKFTAADCKNGKPFQSLMFLIRDWANNDDFEFGIEGGSKYLKEFLKTNKSETDVLQSVRRTIKDSFDNITCALLPNPGKRVAGQVNKNKNAAVYDGNWNEMDEDFKDELEVLVENLLKPDNLFIKKINGMELKGAQLKGYIVSYLELFKSDTLPEPLTIYEATIEKQISLIVDKCFIEYKTRLLIHEDLIVSEAQIPVFHKEVKKTALSSFNKKKKMGHESHTKKFEEILVVKMNEYFEIWKSKSEENVKKMKKEVKDLEKLLEQNKNTEEEAKENKNIAENRLQEIENLNEQSAIKVNDYEHEKKILIMRIDSETIRLKEIDAEKTAEQLRKEKIASALSLVLTTAIFFLL